ncbi:hypothetical protein CSC70_01140 [Pseudoxanthomonas kalamensis DSM 18571]|uniref:GGDEF domain-containing protein n=1 Tax=Pseudoxanthomonas kalamensis TaxID=289483 RepID=UPI0013912216|nr:GGDEF domain-containing protein [Pseudoxanthomonas kalamensis]KAF1712168.1 hypothetical protein CSC70_01140 [Pseudoxanthomonas kalamensis DSM 18571]
MTTDFYALLFSDSILALLLLGLFRYVAHVAQGQHGITLWGFGHLLYTLGATLLDGVAELFVQLGDPQAAYWATNVGGVMACIGLALLAGSMAQFVQQRGTRRQDLALVLVCTGFSVAAWFAFGGSTDAQGAAMSAAELLALSLIIWQLRRIDAPPGRLPARLMMAGCAILLWLYGNDLYRAFAGTYGPNQDWVNIDLATWYMLNFCMLMLSSFRAAESLRRSALFDPLTNSLNRRGLTSRLQDHVPLTIKSNGMAVIALDLDHFKQINDRYGHQAGDTVLRAFSDAVLSCIRNDDLFARVGGEEFVVVSRNISGEYAQVLAERIRRTVEKLELAEISPERISVSLGLGVSSGSRSTEALMQVADDALYEAKRLGRNRVVLRRL